MSDPTQGWKTLASTTLFSNPRVRLMVDEVRTPQGATSTYAMARFAAPGCCILPIDGEGHTFLVGQYRYPVGRYTWELPAGSIGADPDPLTGARRELAEETGFTAAHWHPFLHLAPVNASTNMESFAYLAWDLTPGAQNPDPGEEITLRRVPYAEALEMVLRGEITSATSVGTLLQAHTLALRGRMPAAVQAVLRAGL